MTVHSFRNIGTIIIQPTVLRLILHGLDDKTSVAETNETRLKSL